MRDCQKKISFDGKNGKNKKTSNANKNEKAITYEEKLVLNVQAYGIGININAINSVITPAPWVECMILKKDRTMMKMKVLLDMGEDISLISIIVDMGF